MKEKIIDLIVSLGYKDYDIQEFYYSEYKQKSYSGMIDKNNSVISADKEGYLLFINPCTLANWSHECYYYILDDDANIIAFSEGMWPPYESDKLIKLDMKKLAPNSYQPSEFLRGN